ncbi:MAG TPA: amylo-alpha-1,6-glucosidase [Candidatus Acidoferrales bacterium]
MKDVIEVDHQYYLLATSSLADDRSRVLKYGKTFGVFNRFGDIESVGLAEQGIYHEGTRYLSRFVLKLGGESPQLLRSTVRDDNSFLTVDAMNVDLSDGEFVSIPRGAIHLFRSKFLRWGVCYELVRLSNYSLDWIEPFITCEFGADYRDIFEVRGAQRAKRGQCMAPRIEDSAIVFSYEGLDNVLRSTRIEFAVKPKTLSSSSARFEFGLRPKEEASLYITTSCEEDHRRVTIVGFDQALQRSTGEIENATLNRASIAASDPRFNAWVRRSAADIQMMLAGNPEGAYPYGGVPWFSTVFGRDGIITARELLWIDPEIAKSVLKFLAETQATEGNREQDAEPGKIIHEMRGGEMAALKEIPFGRYYGSIDSTPLFVMLAGDYLDRTDDREFLHSIWPNVLAALNWIDEYGDVDGDCFIEYKAKSARGLIQQGWKDSHDAVFYADGYIAEPPIALCEVQGYAYAAKLAGAKLAQAFGAEGFAERLNQQAHELQAKFNHDFWDEELGTFVLALDGLKRKCSVKSSNPGHCLFSGIASQERAARVAESLLGDELFSGWGVRTLGSGEVRYNPMSYHNGSVWPHDNAIAAYGLARYGFYDQAARIFSTMLDVSEFMDLHRLPELFCGFHRRAHSEGPTLYPVACSPQSWAAGAIYLLVEACLGIRFDLSNRSIQLRGKSLPDFLRGLTIPNLIVRDSLCDIEIEQDAAGLRGTVTRQTGRIAVIL